MAEVYYIFIDGEKEGPYSLSEIGTMLEDDVVSFDDYCVRLGGARRVRLDTLFEEVPDDEEEEEGDKTEEDGEEEEWEYEYEEEEEDSEDVDGSEEEVDGEEDDSLEATPPGKRIYYVGHPSFLKNPIALILCVASAAGGYLLGPTSLWYFISGCLISLLVLSYIVIDRTTRRYIVTARRVELEWGLLVKSSNEVLIRDIRTVNVQKSGLMGLLGIGTIEFSSTGDGVDVTFADVWAAHRVKRLVREIQDAEEADEEWE